jgi:3-hydroxyacyl-CoA dehydrogenase
MSELAGITRDGDIGIVTLHNPPVNALSVALVDKLVEVFETLRQDESVRAVVLIGGGRAFSAGADINRFGQITSGQERGGSSMPRLLDLVEQFPRPVVAAIGGFAYGGGLELAYACHYRVAARAAQIGQPEVKIGLIPGAGGTQRLPRLAGVAMAAELSAIGEPIGASEAHRSGIIDQVIEGDLRAGAIAFTCALAVRGEPPRRTCDLTVDPGGPQATAGALSALRGKLDKRSPHLLAPRKAIEAVEAAAMLPFAEGLKKEAEIFRECLFSDQSKALIHVFFGEREVTRVPGIPKETPVLPIKRAAVVGAGTMGGGITMVYANAGIPVLLKEVGREALDRGLATIRKNYEATVQKGGMTTDQMTARLALIEPTLTYDRFAEADIVVEAVFEGMELKKQVFAELDRAARPGAILASNTSTLDIDAIAAATNRPEMVIGHHYFSPANVMRLLEIVRGRQTSPMVLGTSMALAKTLGKVGVVVGNCRGFVGNRMFGVYQREAQFLVEEGARVEAVDAALVDFGMAMGPLAVCDLAGLDVGWRIRKEYRHLIPPGTRQPLVADQLCEQGRYGQKTCAGWYRYEPGSRRPQRDPEVERLIAESARAAGIEQRGITTQEIVERTIFALVNEGARILDGGFAARAVDIDIIYINGYGFPAYRGGPMWYADAVGLAQVLDRIRQFEQQHGAAWSPSALLVRLAESGRSFAELDREQMSAL